MLKVRNITLGNGIPKIIVPLVGSTESELLEEAHHVMELKPDMVEWRIDAYEMVENLESVQALLSSIRGILSDTPLLFTFRSSHEGGKRKVSVDFYQELIEQAIHTRLIDLVDIELFQGDALVKELVSIARKNGVYVILSNHDFQKTPSKEVIITRLRKMEELGADIPKIAVMATDIQDVLTLLDATNTMKEKFSDRPFITISMGDKGIVSRFTGEVFGSAATFASGKKESAPGQIDINELRSALEIIHRNIS